jgi:hypothetical protein
VLLKVGDFLWSPCCSTIVPKGTSSIAPDASNDGVAPPWSALFENCGDLNDPVVGEQLDFRSSEFRK